MVRNVDCLSNSLMMIRVSKFSRRKHTDVITFLSLSSDSIRTGMIKVVSVRSCVIVQSTPQDTGQIDYCVTGLDRTSS